MCYKSVSLLIESSRRYNLIRNSGCALFTRLEKRHLHTIRDVAAGRRLLTKRHRSLRIMYRLLPIFCLFTYTEALLRNYSSLSIKSLDNFNVTSTKIITKLDLSSNFIENIRQINFKNADRLRELDLSRNNLSEIEGSAFRVLKKLDILLLGRNSIQTLPNNVFSGLHSLRTLDLSFNNLTSFKSRWLSSVPKLVTLNVRYNMFQHLESGLFAKAKYLRYVDLSFNRLLDLPSNLVGHRTDMRLLNLAYNQLTIVNNDLSYALRFCQLNLTGNFMDCTCALVALRQLFAWTSANSSSCKSPDQHIGKRLHQIHGKNLVCSQGGGSRLTFQIYGKGHSHYLPRNYVSAYDPTIGYGTAVTLLAMLVGFLACVVIDKVKRRLKRRIRAKRGFSTPAAPSRGASSRSRNSVAMYESCKFAQRDAFDAWASASTSDFNDSPTGASRSSFRVKCRSPSLQRQTTVI